MKHTIGEVLHSRSVNLLMSMALAICWAVFAWFNLKAFFMTGIFALLLFFLSESLQALFFMLRKEPKTVAVDPFAWAVALGGTFALLNLRPGGEVIWQGGSTLVVVGFSLQILALLSLNTSFAIAPANRGIKTDLGYRLVRHPIYATYLISTSGYFLFNASLANVGWIGLFIVLTLLRIREEEKHLSKDEGYRAYMKKVPYRLVPFVY